MAADSADTGRDRGRGRSPISSRLLRRIEPAAFGMAGGAVLGLVLVVSALAARLGGLEGELSTLLPGYAPSGSGLVVGALYGLGIGFVAGYAFATVRNAVLAVYLRFAWSRLQHHAASDLLDRMI